MRMIAKGSAKGAKPGMVKSPAMAPMAKGGKVKK